MSMSTVIRRLEYSLFICILVTGLVTTSFCIREALSFEQSIIDSTEVEIEKISYLGNDDYRIEITLKNRSLKTVSIKGFERQFYAQTETGWKRLSNTSTGSPFDVRDDSLPAMGKRKFIAILKIPLNIRGLFRTSEGDVSFMFEYRLQLADNPESGYSETYYWITPMTDKWIHREGM